jgi:hypothetical protein
MKTALVVSILALLAAEGAAVAQVLPLPWRDLDTVVCRSYIDEEAEAYSGTAIKARCTAVRVYTVDGVWVQDVSLAFTFAGDPAAPELTTSGTIAFRALPMSPRFQRNKFYSIVYADRGFVPRLATPRRMR